MSDVIWTPPPPKDCDRFWVCQDCVKDPESDSVKGLCVLPKGHPGECVCVCVEDRTTKPWEAKP